MKPRQPEQTHYFGHGHLSYVQIPALDVRQSAEFYANVFGWKPRGGSAHHFSFTDATGEIIGAWITDRAPSGVDGVVVYIYVHGITSALERVLANGGEVVRPVYDEGDLWVAVIRDPAGNIIGVWQKQDAV